MSVWSAPYSLSGLHLGVASRRKDLWDPILVEIQNRLDSWTNITLSKAGRLTIVKSILANIPVYYLSLFHMPISVVTQLEKLFRRFFWQEEEG